jgi:hypothetical protein
MWRALRQTKPVWDAGAQCYFKGKKDISVGWLPHTNHANNQKMGITPRHITNTADTSGNAKISHAHEFYSVNTSYKHLPLGKKTARN